MRSCASCESEEDAEQRVGQRFRGRQLQVELDPGRGPGCRQGALRHRELALDLGRQRALDRGEHAVEAFEVNAVDYLLKPVEKPRLEQALQRVRRRRDAGAPMTEHLEKIVRMVGDRQQRRGKVAVQVGERFLLVQADDVIYASLNEDTISIVTGQVAGTSNYRTLDELQASLDPDVFWRVHRSHLVNINKIKEIVPWFSRNYILRMKDAKATEIPVSRSQTRRLREYLGL